jgi:hypothetical protein
MATLSTPGGAQVAGSPGTRWLPDWRPNAITWTRRSDGKQFTAPSNPVRAQDSAPTFLTNRQTQDGMLTYIWAVNPEQAPLNFVTFEEGIAPWKQFREDFRGVQVTYYNDLDGVILPVTISDVAWQGDGQNPASWKVTVTQQEAEPFK